jgi:hypothetical protein
MDCGPITLFLLYAFTNTIGCSFDEAGVVPADQLSSTHSILLRQRILARFSYHHMLACESNHTVEVPPLQNIPLTDNAMGGSPHGGITVIDITDF